MKIYSPNGPRNGVVIIFLTQSSKSHWLSKLSAMITRCTPEPIFPSSPSPPLIQSTSLTRTSPPSPSQYVSSSPNQHGQRKRRVSLSTIHSEGNGSPPSNHPQNGHASLSNSCSLAEESTPATRHSPRSRMMSRTSSLHSFDEEGKPSPEIKYV